MQREKIFTLTWERRGKERNSSGTIAELYKYFGCTIEVGRSYNDRISRKQPTTIKQLVSLINRCVDIKQGACYDREYVSIKEGLIINREGI